MQIWTGVAVVRPLRANNSCSSDKGWGFNYTLRDRLLSNWWGVHIWGQSDCSQQWRGGRNCKEEKELYRQRNKDKDHSRSLIRDHEGQKRKD